MRKLSSSPKDAKYGVQLPVGNITEIGVHSGLPLIDNTIKRVSKEIFDVNRGSFIYDDATDTYVCHLIVSDADKKACNPFLKDATDVWLVIDAHSDLPMVDLSEREEFLNKLSEMDI